MSLSSIGKSVTGITALAAAALAGQQYAVPVYNYMTEGPSVDMRDARITKRSITYRIDTDDAVTFGFSQPVTEAKVLVDLSVDEQLRNLEGGFVYGLRMRWLGANGAELSTHEAYFQSDPPDQVFESGIIWRFFRSDADMIAEQESLVVESPTAAMWLEIEAFDADPGITSIDVRVFEQRSYIGNQPLQIFRRLSKDSKALLTTANAFPVTMLTEQEQMNLGRNFWRPVGPLGIDGRDYQKLVLYEATFESARESEGGKP